MAGARYGVSTRRRNDGEEVVGNEDGDSNVQRLTQSARVCSLEDVRRMDDEDEAQVEEALGTVSGGGPGELIPESEESSLSSDDQTDQLMDDDTGEEEVQNSESTSMRRTVEDAVPDTASATMSEGEPMDVDEHILTVEEPESSLLLRGSSEPPTPPKDRSKDRLQPRPASSVPPPSKASYSVPPSIFYSAAGPSRVHSKPTEASSGENSETGDGLADGEDEIDQIFDSATRRYVT